MRGRKGRERGLPLASARRSKERYLTFLGRNQGMIPKFTRLMRAVGLLAIAGGMLCGGTLLAADEPDQDNLRPPQTLPTGFESTDKLLRDLEKAENAPLYSAWLVESSRFLYFPSAS